MTWRSFSLYLTLLYIVFLICQHLSLSFINIINVIINRLGGQKWADSGGHLLWLDGRDGLKLFAAPRPCLSFPTNPSHLFFLFVFICQYCIVFRSSSFHLGCLLQSQSDMIGNWFLVTLITVFQNHWGVWKRHGMSPLGQCPEWNCFEHQANNMIDQQCFCYVLTIANHCLLSQPALDQILAQFPPSAQWWQ